MFTLGTHVDNVKKKTSTLQDFFGWFYYCLSNLLRDVVCFFLTTKEKLRIKIVIPLLLDVYVPIANHHF